MNSQCASLEGRVNHRMALLNVSVVLDTRARDAKRKLMNALPLLADDKELVWTWSTASSVCAPLVTMATHVRT